MKVTDNQGGFINMITTVQKLRMALGLVFLILTFIDFNLLWLSLLCVTCVDLVDSLDK